MNPASPSHARLTIDLSAIGDNYRRLQRRFTGGETAAVVKANAYGLGVAPVSKALHAAGCRRFFVATVDEAVELRGVMPGATVHVFHGVQSQVDVAACREHNLAPVVNSLGQLTIWAQEAARVAAPLPCILHLDTGMNRLGLSRAEAEYLASHTQLIEKLDVLYVMTHMACADDASHPMNPRQLAAFKALISLLPAPSRGYSLANSSAVFLDPQYHFNLARPGVALYGCNPVHGQPNPMRPVAALHAPIVQLRELTEPGSVNYAASRHVPAGTKLATLAAGYADGLPFQLGNTGVFYIDDYPCPVLGRVTMDLTVIDVSAVPEHLARPGRMVEIFGNHCGVDTLADRAKTIPYEILTKLGKRLNRIYES